MAALKQTALLIALLFLFQPGLARTDGYDRIAAKIAPAARKLKQRRIAVLPFPYIDKRACSGPQEVQERLATRLVALQDLQVVERAALGQMFEEITLGYKGLLDPRSSYQLGKILDAEAVLTGTLVELPNGKVQINARLIRLPDGLILTAAEGLVKRTWKDPASVASPPSIKRWFQELFAFSPPTSGFHAEADINRFIAEQFDALKASAVPPRPAAASEEPLIFPIPNLISEEKASKDLGRGRWLYEQSCTYCHGPHGRGSQAMAEVFGLTQKDLNLNLKPLASYTAETLVSKLKNGTTRMPVYKKPLPREDAEALLQYLRHLTDSSDCAEARARIDKLQSEILELKARYWAGRLRKSGTPPGKAPEGIFSVMEDPSLRKRFHDRLEEISRAQQIQKLTQEELKRFVFNDNLAYSLRQSCGL